MKGSRVSRVVAILRDNPDQRFSTFELAQAYFKLYPGECREKLAKSKVLKDDRDLIAQLSAEISADSFRFAELEPERIQATEGRPRRYYYTEKTPSDQVSTAEDAGVVITTDNKKLTLSEASLYPLLCEYLLRYRSVYSMRIDEKHSSMKLGAGGNMWLHPDVVGMEDLGRRWDPEVKSCVGFQSSRRATLWSFEVKLIINRANARECFFQAVSNSSWATYGYLVAAEITGDGTIGELQLLSAAHGIGVIALNPSVLSESQVVLPARERMDVDWDTVDRIAKANKDFLEFVKVVRQFHQIGEMQPERWFRMPKE